MYTSLEEKYNMYHKILWITSTGLCHVSRINSYELYTGHRVERPTPQEWNCSNHIFILRACVTLYHNPLVIVVQKQLTITFTCSIHTVTYTWTELEDNLLVSGHSLMWQLQSRGVKRLFWIWLQFFSNYAHVHFMKQLWDF